MSAREYRAGPVRMYRTVPAPPYEEAPPAIRALLCGRDALTVGSDQARRLRQPRPYSPNRMGALRPADGR